MSGLLINERFVAVFPSLVRLLGSLESAVILQHLHFNADDTGAISISMRQISEDTGISYRTVERKVQGLREEGWITGERTSTYDATLTYRIDHARLATPSPASAGVDPARVADSEPATVADSSFKNVRTSSTSSASRSRRPEPHAHDRQSMTPSWVPTEDFWRYLRATYDVDMQASLTRFRAYQIDNNRYSRCWENSFEAWVTEDDRRRRAEVETGTDDLGVPLTQRKTSAVQGALRPGDEGYVNPEELWPGASVTETEQQDE